MFRLDDSEVDLDTGQKTHTVSSQAIRRCVQVPIGIARQVIFTPAMMQSLRPFAWQGGAGQNVQETMFLIYKNELRGWGDITPEQWVHFRGRNYQVVEAINTPGGWFFTAKQARGESNAHTMTVKHETVVSQSVANTVV